MKVHRFQCETIVSAPLAAVFEFFSNAENLERLTPKSLHFQILTPRPIVMGLGTQIDYRLRLLGVPFRWQTAITVWEPGVRFVDVQRRGPYRLWEHEHTFFEHDAGTRMRDDLRYAVPGGPLQPIITALFVRRRVQGIFAYRSQAIKTVFAQAPESALEHR